MADKTVLAMYLKHVDKFGDDGVMDAAIHSEIVGKPMTLSELVALQKHIDSKRPKHAPKMRLSAETRVKRLLGLDKEETECSDSSQPRAT